MSQQHQKWITITDLLKTGKGSVDLKLRVSKILSIREPWEEFEEN